MRLVFSLLLAFALVVTPLALSERWLRADEGGAAVARDGGTGHRATALTPAARTSAAIRPIRAIFYYPWFPQTWHGNDHYDPSLGRYSSDSLRVLNRHFRSMRYARLDAAISSWWGRGTVTGKRLPKVLKAADAHGLAVAPYYEKEYGDKDPPLAALRRDLSYLKRLSTRPGWLHVSGKPVIFVYNAGKTGCADVTRWRRATRGWSDFYVQMKVFPGYQDCRYQPASWHQYGPATNRSLARPYSFNVSPGFWHHAESSPRLARSLARFKRDLRAQVAGRARWQLVTSFSEWGEGTAVESAKQWASASGHGKYLDAMRRAYRPARSRVTAPARSSAGTTVVWAVGDICDDDHEEVDCADVGRLIRRDAATDAVLGLGDLQYEDGTLSDYRRYYDKKMGSGPGLKSKTYPAPGNHEYRSPGAAGYFRYWGARAGRPSRGYYAAKLGSWRLVVANSNCSEAGGCERTSPQGRFLLRQLKRAGRCSVVITHHPAISDGVYAPGTTDGRQLFKLAYEGRAELFLSGHDHEYQRFAPRNKALRVDRRRGVRQFVVGTGGKNLTSFGSRNRSQYRQNKAFGALRLSLKAGSYSYRFVNVRGVTMDSGGGRCH